MPHLALATRGVGVTWQCLDSAVLCIFGSPVTSLFLLCGRSPGAHQDMVTDAQLKYKKMMLHEAVFDHGGMGARV